MITADLDSIERQLPEHSGLKQAVEFLRRGDLENLPEGKFEIDGERVFARVQRYHTVRTDNPRFETHRKYIDVQFVARGEEILGWIPAAAMNSTEPYDSDRDIAFGEAPVREWTPLRLKAGQAAVLWPEDGHAPKIATGESLPVLKIVVKVAL